MRYEGRWVSKLEVRGKGKRGEGGDPILEKVPSDFLPCKNNFVSEKCAILLILILFGHFCIILMQVFFKLGNSLRMMT